jgi:CHAT domain-containing protein
MRASVAVRLVCLVASLLPGALVAAQSAPEGAGKPTLSAAQQQRLKERQRRVAEVAKIWQAGKHAEAMATWAKEVAADRMAFGTNHEEVVWSLQFQARLHEFRADFAAARKTRQEVLAIRTRLYGVKDWLVTDARLELKNLEERASMTAVDRQRLEWAELLNREVLRLLQAARPKEALPLARRALAIREQLLGEAHFDYAISLGNLAGLYRAMGEYGKALPLFEQARDLCKRVLGEAHPSYASSLHNLAVLWGDLGVYGKALPLYQQAQNLRKQLLGEAHPDYAHGLNGLALLYRAMGEYGKALPLFEQARDLRKRLVGEAHPHYADSLNNLALLYRDMGEYGKALPLLEQARDLYKRHWGDAHPDYATSLHNLATLYRDMGEYGKALPLAQQATDLHRKALGEAHPQYANSLNGLAVIYRELAEYGKALPLYQQSRDLRKRVLGEAHPDYAHSLNNLAVVHADLGEYAKALPLLEQARDLHKRLLGEDHPAYAHSLNGLSYLYWATNNMSEAAKVAEKRRALLQAFLDRTFTDQSTRQRSNLLGQHRHALDMYLGIALGTGTPPPRLYAAALAWKGALATRAAEERLVHDRPELRPLADQLRLARASLARVANRQPANERQQAEWRALFDRLEKEKEDLELRLAQKSATYLRSLKLRQSDAGQVSAALPRGAALVDFLEYNHWSPPTQKKGRWKVEARLLAFVLTRERPPALVPLGSAKQIDAAVRAWRRAVQAYQDPQAAAAELSRRVWQPLQQHLAGAHTVLLAPDGPLCGLAFAALPGPKANTYLIEEVALGHVSSGRHLLELAADDDGPRGQGLLAVGGLVYGDAKPPPPGAAAKKGYGYLPGTRLEAERLGRLFRQQFPGAEAPLLLTGADVDADALTSQLPPTRAAARPRYLHLATHGFFEPPSAEAIKLRWPAEEQLLPFGLAKEYRTYTRNPLLLCGLVLAGANLDREKGILRAEEVAGLDLRGCELAVLSACETALGKVADTEGVQGLQRAFHAAGARSLVVSLWKVHDAATSVLMEEFYANLWQKKLPRLEALRQAQLTVLRNPARVQQRQRELAKLGVRGPEDEPAPLPQGGAPAAARSHPALWAAFILSGDTAPVVEGDRKAGQPK